MRRDRTSDWMVLVVIAIAFVVTLVLLAKAGL